MARSPKPSVSVDLEPKPDTTASGGAWPLMLDHVHPWCWKKQLFTESEIETILNVATSAELSKGTTYGGGHTDIRDSFVRFLYPNDFTGWVFGRITQAVVEMNAEFFGFDLSGIEQGLQFTRYVAPGQHYNWHLDRAHQTPTRKLSVSVQLSDPSSYKGGNLQFRLGPKTETITKELGMATFFPSWTLHRVSKVTEGVRDSLVAWVNGPSFK